MFRVHRVWSILQPQRPRHPLISAVLAIFALCVMLFVLAAGAVIGMIVFGTSLVLRMFRTPAPRHYVEQPEPQQPMADGDVIDGEFSVLRKPLPRIAEH